MTTAADRKDGEQGITLLELLVVGVLIGIMLAVTVPNVQNLLGNDPLKSSARLTAAALTEARRLAMGSENGVAVTVDMAANRLIIGDVSKHPRGSDVRKDEGKTIRLADSVAIVSVWTGLSQHGSDDAVPIWINNRGMVEPVIINLSDGDRVIGLRGSPFFLGIEIVDRELPPAPLSAQLSLNQ